MLNDTTIEAFNTRLTVDLNSIKQMKPSELDRVKSHGSAAEALLKNRDLALFVHQWQFEIMDQLTLITGHDPDSNCQRVALSNQLAGIESFISTLKRSVSMKNRAVSLQNPAVTDKENINDN